jgi:hypothetical protein
MVSGMTREIKDIKDEPPPTRDGEVVYVQLHDGWTMVYTAENGRWGMPYRCNPPVMD